MDINQSPNRFPEKQKETQIEKKKVDKVVSGNVKTKKKSGLTKLADNIFAEDRDKVKNYILMDILLPTISDGIVDILKKSIDAIFGRESSKRDTKASRISYRSYYDDSRDSRDRDRSRVRYEYDDIIFNSRGEAEEVLERMDELIETYGNASVADFYDLVGVTGKYTDNKYGWKDIHTAKVVRVSGDGYMIKLPMVTPL